MEDEISKINKKATLAIKIALCSVCVSLLLGIFSLWVVLNQVTLNVGMDKKINKIETYLKIRDDGLSK